MHGQGAHLDLCATSSHRATHDLYLDQSRRGRPHNKRCWIDAFALEPPSQDSLTCAGPSTPFWSLPDRI
jgi:hypothetical protein